MKFDMNAVISGSSISHTEGSSDFTINTPGMYTVAFNGNFAPASNVNFPLPVSLDLELNGTIVPGAAAAHSFHTSSDAATLSFSFPVEISTAPATLRIMAQGGNFVYTIASFSIYKVKNEQQ